MKQTLHELIDRIDDKYENVFIFLIRIVKEILNDLPCS